MSEKIRTATVRDIDQYLSDDAEVCAWEDVKNVLDAKNKALELAKVLVKMDAVTIQNKDNEIAKLKQKLHDAEMQADLAECAVTEYKIDCDKLNDKNRRLKRALYKACANWMIDRQCAMSCFHLEARAKKFDKAIDKCRAMAEKFKEAK